MARDPISDRFAKKEREQKLSELAKRARPKDDVEAEEKLLKDTKKTDPLHAADKVGRNDSCPCGSGKKYKRCCGAK